MNKVTSANHAFFHCLSGLAESVRKHYNKPLIVYDVGLTEEDRSKLDAHIIQIDVDSSCFDFATDGDSRFVKTTHKPACIKHYFKNFTEKMIFVDADCLFMERVEESGFDVGVTLRTGKGLDLTDHFNGVLNAGVLFFNTSADELVDPWAEECQKENTTDQKALTDILSETIDWKRYNHIYDWHGLKVKVFKTDDYNDYHLKTGKIFHFKGLMHEKGIYEQLLAANHAGKDMYKTYKRLRRKRKASWWQQLFQKWR